MTDMPLPQSYGGYALPKAESATQTGEVMSAIIDPFAGSGTTLVAARNLGHDCTGIEMSAAYNTVAKSRLGL